MSGARIVDGGFLDGAELERVRDAYSRGELPDVTPPAPAPEPTHVEPEAPAAVQQGEPKPARPTPTTVQAAPRMPAPEPPKRDTPKPPEPYRRKKPTRTVVRPATPDEASELRDLLREGFDLARDGALSDAMRDRLLGLVAGYARRR